TRVDCGDLSAGPDPAADHDRRGEPHLVGAVVDPGRPPVVVDDLGHQQREEGQREVAVGDGGTERSGRRAPGMDVDPLVGAGRIGEGVDAILVDRHPVAVSEVVADRGGELVEAGERPHPRGPPATYNTCPETNEAPSLTKNDTAWAMSSGWPTRGTGVSLARA